MTTEYVLLDTDVTSFFLRRDTRAAAYEVDLKGKVPAISFQTRAELLRWPIERKWGPERSAKLESALRNFLVIDSSPELAEKWAEVRAAGRLHGHIVGDADVWIGATAILYGVPLMSHNRRHFEWMKPLGLKLISHAPA